MEAISPSGLQERRIGSDDIRGHVLGTLLPFTNIGPEEVSEYVNGSSPSHSVDVIHISGYLTEHTLP